MHRQEPLWCYALVLNLNQCINTLQHRRWSMQARGLMERLSLQHECLRWCHFLDKLPYGNFLNGRKKVEKWFNFHKFLLAWHLFTVFEKCLVGSLCFKNEAFKLSASLFILLSWSKSKKKLLHPLHPVRLSSHKSWHVKCPPLNTWLAYHEAKKLYRFSFLFLTSLANKAR